MTVGFIGSEANMILVKIDVVSGGDYDRQKQIGAIEIANVTGFGTGRISSDYKYRLFSEGGEKQFIKRMIQESKKFAPNCLWFSTLVSKEATLISVKRALKKAVATEVKIIEMGQGQKKSRIVAWSFLKEKRRDQWVTKRWKMEEKK